MNEPKYISKEEISEKRLELDGITPNVAGNRKNWNKWDRLHS